MLDVVYLFAGSRRASHIVFTLSVHTWSGRLLIHAYAPFQPPQAKRSVCVFHAYVILHSFSALPPPANPSTSTHFKSTHLLPINIESCMRNKRFPHSTQPLSSVYMLPPRTIPSDSMSTAQGFCTPSLYSTPPANCQPFYHCKYMQRQILHYRVLEKHKVFPLHTLLLTLAYASLPDAGG